MELKELYNEIKRINSEIKGYKKLINILKKEGKNEEMDIWKERKSKIEEEKNELNERIKSLRKEREEVKTEIIGEKNKEMEVLRKKDREVTIK